jgi:DeoR/GlpR family transcriptional regulator of sugar metabolism
MFAQERHHAIKEIVRKHRRMNFVDLQRLLKVSPATLRRDLTELEEAREIIRVHGGVLDPNYARSEISFDERMLRNRAAKKAIAEAAANLIAPGSSVFIDAGSTCLEAGKALLGRKDIRIITHSVALVEAAFHGEAPILCVGGELRKVSGALTGGAALGALASLHIDVALVGASGLDPVRGCFTTELSEAEMKRAILSRAARKVLLADHAKWRNPSTVLFAPWSDFDDWIMDGNLAMKETKHLRAAGLKIQQA